jgi:hypothetical protein
MAVGEDAVAASVSARRGVGAAAPAGSIVGELVASVRWAPLVANWLAGLAASADSAGCVRSALLATAAVWREIVADDGPGLATAAVTGPALAGTSPTVVTTFVAELAVLRLVVATAWGATTGASAAADPLAERRTSVGVAAG